MSKSYINAVIAEDGWSLGDFRINPYTNMLQYKIEDDLVDTIDNENDDRRPAKLSDLSKLLKLRNYNLVDSKGIDPQSGELGFISSYDEDGCSNKIEVISNSISISEIARITGLQSDLLNMQVGFIPGTYIDDGSGDYSSPDKYGLKENFYNFRVVKDLLRRSTVINALALNNLTYTDTINLGTTLHEVPEHSKVSVKVGIQFTIKGSEVVHLKELIFPYEDDTQYNINDDVSVEYLDKVVRLFPSEEVNECIISYCHIIYE